MTRHGRTARTPASDRDPGLLAGPRLPAQTPPVPVQGPGDAARTDASRAELVRLADALLVQPTVAQRNRQQNAVNRVLAWLEEFPGENWQDRWVLSGSDEQEPEWGPSGLSAARRSRFTAGLCALLALRALRPSYRWLFGSRLLGAYDTYRRHNQTAVFGQLQQHLTERGGCDEYADEALNLLTRMVIVTGKDLLDLDVEDVTAYARARQATGRPVASLPLAYQALHAVGGLQGGAADVGAVPLTREADPGRARRPLPGRRPGRPGRPGPLPGRAGRGARLRLPGQPVPDAGGPVLDRSGAPPPRNLLPVSPRCGRTGVEAADPRAARRPAPPQLPRRAVGRALLLPGLAAVVAGGPGPLGALGRPMPDPRNRCPRLHQGGPAPPGPDAAAHPHPGTGASTTRRSGRGATASIPARSPGRPTRLTRRPLHRGGDPVSTHRPRPQPLAARRAVRHHPRRRSRSPLRRRTRGRQRLLVLGGDRGPATDRRPDRGTPRAHPSEPASIPGPHRRNGAAAADQPLQDRPGTGRPRRPPADPDLVAVLARILRRIKTPDGHVPLLSRYDGYERTFGAPLPHLFQRPYQHRRDVISPARVRRLLTDLALRAAILDVDGTPLRFTPHDFRRIFATETVNGGLPIHIAAKLLGHLDLNTTQGYVAVYPQEVIRHYRQFVDQRRARRPSEEYRQPTDVEWDEFRDHFSLRKVALGTCNRPYGTPCQHEHACIRCPMLRLDPAQLPRLHQVEVNTRERLQEAHRMQWLGEVSGLQDSLRHIADKKQQAERLGQLAADTESDDSALG